MANKYYAVKVGRKCGIFRSWDDCKAQVTGFSGAVYKSFPTLTEAEAYLGLQDGYGSACPASRISHNVADKDAVTEYNELISAEEGTFGIVTEGYVGATLFGATEEDTFDAAKLAEDEMAAFVDGSYKLATKEFSYGAVLFYRGEAFELSGKSDDPDFAAMRNVAGEIMGSVKAMRFAIEKQIPRIHIYHDYEGIAQWCTGGWQAKNKCTQQYRMFYLQARRNGLDVVFHKVKGHSGVEFNERADALAKAALGIEK